MLFLVVIPPKFNKRGKAMESFDLNKNDVVSMDVAKSLVSSPTFKVEEASLKMMNKFIDNGHTQVEAHYFTEHGVRCELLKADGKGWRKGRIRFRLEFIPDPEPHSTDAVLGRN
jgi:KGK domain